ncbi:hypothetical protein AFL01nite_08200 [Aeromicrobium flavum]|uniref:Uncharacterized protein n=1 Tax=Aeromicrobium flavum TaxID=416568 RepID=A0A512HSQ6_9ACTN|nr:hypothetical protein AFL01nite_08200 [Aeromicrobium flavum]
MATAGVGDEPARTGVRSQLGHDAGERVVGHRHDDDLGTRHDLGGLEHGDVGEQRLDAQLRGGRTTADADEMVTGSLEPGGEDSTDTAGADHTHAGVRHVCCLSFQSRSGYQTK